MNQKTVCHGTDLDQHAADDRRDRRRHPEDHRDLAHHPLGLRPVEEVADDGPADDRRPSGGQALGDAPHEEPLQGRGEGAGHRSEGVHDQGAHDHRAAPDRVGQRSVEEAHRREREHVGRHDQLQLTRRHVQRVAHLRERRERRVDAEGADHREQRQHQRDRATSRGGEDGRVRPLPHRQTPIPPPRGRVPRIARQNCSLLLHIDRLRVTSRTLGRPPCPYAPSRQGSRPCSP